MSNKHVLLKKQVDMSAANGSLDVDIAAYAGYVLLGMVSAIAGGVTPATVVTIFAVDEFNNEHQLSTQPALDTLNEKFVSTQHVQLNNPLSDLIRIRWTTTGAPTTLTVDLSLYGYTLEN